MVNSPMTECTTDRIAAAAIADERQALQAAGVVCVDRHEPQGMPEALRRFLHEVVPDVAVVVVGRGFEAICVPSSWNAPLRLAAWRTLGGALRAGTDGWNHTDGLFWHRYELGDAVDDAAQLPRTPAEIQCPSWCRHDHQDETLQIGLQHYGQEEIRLFEVPGEATLRRRFRLTQFVDDEGDDEPLVQVDDDFHDEPALRAMAETFLTWADRLRRAWGEAADQADVPAVAERSR